MCVDFWRWGSEWNVNSHLRVVKARRLKGVWININHRQVKCHSTAVHFRSGILSLSLSFFLRATDAWLGFQHRLFQLDTHTQDKLSRYMRSMCFTNDTFRRIRLEGKLKGWYEGKTVLMCYWSLLINRCILVFFLSEPRTTLNNWQTNK